MWKKEWHELIAPRLPLKGLLALKEALETNDPALIQKSGMWWGPIGMLRACCPIAYPFWKSGIDPSIVKYRYQEIFAVEGYFTPWYDLTPREEAFKELLVEVKLSIANGEHL